jgi:putative flavoprotein involved in K+ transport
MSAEHVEVAVVGGGQAGIAASEHLSANGIGHVVLERHRIAERWRTERWDSLVANGPAWHDRFPGMEFGGHADGFPGKDDVADYFVAYAERIGAPVRCGVEVHQVRRLDGRASFEVHTSAGTIVADYVIAATGAFQRPVIPELVPTDAPVAQMHSNAYHRPSQLPAGGVLVVGAGSSGAQIAEELQASGRQVYLSVAPHGRPPRRYRGRDFVWWLGVLNKWDAEVMPGAAHVTIAVSGADGGHTVDFRRFAQQGMVLVGTTQRYADGVVHFAADLSANLAAGDADYLGLLAEADAYVAAHGLDLPVEPEAHVIPADPSCVTNPLLSLDLEEAGVSTVLWATGYASDYGWLPGAAVDRDGRPQHRRGISAEAGVYFLGLPWQTRRGSSFIWGVWYDAKYVADHITKQRAYTHYRPA